MQKKRERVLSACGVRQPYNYNNYESPKIAVHKKSDDQTSNLGSVKGTRKDEKVNMNVPPGMRMPPKPQQQSGNNNINYRLPPKPSYNQGGSSNRSYDYDTSKSREKSKQNLRNVGAQIVQSKESPRPPSSNRIGRSSSQQRVNYPSWWG